MKTYATRSEYYEAMKRLADEKRVKYGLDSHKLGLQKMREIYKVEGITIDLWRTSGRIRALYMCDAGEPSVLVNRNLPDVPRLFAMAHELKHHYCDQQSLSNGEIRCGDFNANEVIEKAAEVFAAEFVYSEKDFLHSVSLMRLEQGAVSPEQVVELKRTCGASVSYAFLQKRLEWFKYIQKGEFSKIQFQKLEEQIYGVPIYRQPWFRARRAKRD